MSAVAIVINRLLAASGVTSIVGSRVYPIIPPQGAQPPLIVVHLTGNMDIGRTINSAGNYFAAEVQVHCIDSASAPSGASQVIDLGEAVIAALNGIIKQTVLGSTDVDILLDDGEDNTEHDEMAKAFRRVMRFSVKWRRGS